LISIDNEKRVIDWNLVMADFLAGFSYGELSKKYGVNKGTIAKRSKKEDWTTKKATIAEKVATATAEKTAKAAVDTAVIFERMRKKALIKLERELDAVLEKEGTESRHTETYFSEEGKRTISETTISKLADILALMEKIAGAGFGTNEPQLKAIREILDGVPSAIN
jgi:phenylpyruvate tautomerase PptA (4-oxalocrotonate tautomerase family)